MKTLHQLLVTIILVIPAHSVLAQIDADSTHLGAYWAELGRAVMEGDLDGIRALYHPDAIDHDWQGDSYQIKLISESLNEQVDFHNGTKAGERRIELEWRFSTRIHSPNTAHEIGIARFIETPKDGEATTNYAHVNQYLVKKETWVSLVENVRWNATEEEWNALAPGK